MSQPKTIQEEVTISREGWKQLFQLLGFDLSARLNSYNGRGVYKITLFYRLENYLETKKKVEELVND